MGERLDRAERAMREAADGWVGPRSNPTYRVAAILWALGWESLGDAQLQHLESALPLLRNALETEAAPAMHRGEAHDGCS
jgi:hypothetical protein